MNEIISKFVLTGDKFIPERHLRQPDLHKVLVDHSLKINRKLLSERLKGPYMKYVGGGGRRVFVGAMKYFKHILIYVLFSIFIVMFYFRNFIF